MTKESDLDNLIKEYKKIQNKYGLPDFDSMNQDFQIEKIAEFKTLLLIREIRKFMADKFSNYLKFIEEILHPVSSQMFVFSIIKSLSLEEKTKLTEIYKKLVKIEVRLIELDLEFFEKKEADFIKETYSLWQEIKKEFLFVLDKIKKNWDNKLEGNSRAYFG